ncbi:MAG TPA: N-6 DNA methylase [Candidatus Mediterraneibacter surreyensis]|nr:N-6 DNA methylase [Candidatus Mediterraneibacter surreyensis]
MNEVYRQEIGGRIREIIGMIQPADPKSFLIDLGTCLYDIVLEGEECFSGIKAAVDTYEPAEEHMQYVMNGIYVRHPELPPRRYLPERGILAVSRACLARIEELLMTADSGEWKACGYETQASVIFREMFGCMIRERLINDFLTPEDLCDMMVRMAEPAAGELVLDPACGSGRLLAAANRQCPECIPEGNDMNPAFRELAFFNLFFSGERAARIYGKDFLQTEYDELPAADLILSNPPYTDKSDLTVQFTDRIVRQLKDNGRCAILVPQGFLTNSSSHIVTGMRRWILDQLTLEAVISLPRKIYRPYMESYSSLLMIRRRQSPEDYPVFISMLPECADADVYGGEENRGIESSAGGNYRQAMEEIVTQWKQYQKGEQLNENIARIVPTHVMRENSYIFAAENYWEESYVSVRRKMADLREKLSEEQSRLDRMMAGMFRERNG